RVDGDLASQLADRVTPHSVADDEQVPTFLPFLFPLGHENGGAILVVLPSKTDVAKRRVLDFLLPTHVLIAFPEPSAGSVDRTRAAEHRKARCKAPCRAGVRVERRWISNCIPARAPCGHLSAESTEVDARLPPEGRC